MGINLYTLQYLQIISLPIEIQIRTTNMHKIAESGLASHWFYKDNDSNLSQLQLKTHEWMKNVIETHSNV